MKLFNLESKEKDALKVLEIIKDIDNIRFN